MLVLASNAHGIVGQAAESNINKSYIGLQDINKVLSGTITDTDNLLPEYWSLQNRQRKKR